MGLSERECWFWLCTRSWLGVRSMDRLLGYFKTAKNIYYGRNSDYSRIGGLSKTVVARLQDPKEKDETLVRREMERLEKLGGKFVCRIDGEFPEKLRHIYDAPAGLFYFGRLPEAGRPMIAIVGAREASGYGLSAAEHFAEGLSGMGFGIISGLARGVDSCAHSGALKLSISEGGTWGVLGCGLNICYPKENYPLFEKMKTYGGILTEYPLDAKPEPWHFPHRNRIISGLADGIFVVEARNRSGSLITAEAGLEQGKNIYALPGPFDQELSGGCHYLIQSGAKLVTKPEDIAEDYDTFLNCLKKTPEKIKISLDYSEQLVYANLSLTPKDVDSISFDCGLSITETLRILVNLELKGKVRQMGKGLYMRRL